MKISPLSKDHSKGDKDLCARARQKGRKRGPTTRPRRPVAIQSRANLVPDADGQRVVGKSWLFGEFAFFALTDLSPALSFVKGSRARAVAGHNLGKPNI